MQRAKLFARSLASMVTSPPGKGKLGKRLQGIPAALRRGRVRNPATVSRDDGSSLLTLPEAGYTFATSHPGIATVLTGTTDITHLQRNVRAALAPALSPAEVEKLSRLIDAG